MDFVSINNRNEFSNDRYNQTNINKHKHINININKTNMNEKIVSPILSVAQVIQKIGRRFPQRDVSNFGLFISEPGT